LETGKNLEVEIRVAAKDGMSIYAATVVTRDPRQVWNKIRIGRNAVRENTTTVHLVKEDPHPFRVGSEKDTVEWLRERFREAGQ
jgi:hypothetical protein